MTKYTFKLFQFFSIRTNLGHKHCFGKHYLPPISLSHLAPKHIRTHIGALLLGHRAAGQCHLGHLGSCREVMIMIMIMIMMVTSPGHTAAWARRHRPVWEHSDTGWDIPEAGHPGAQRSTAVWEHWSTAACKQCRYVMRRNVGSICHLEVVRHCCLGIVLQCC